MMWTGTGRVTSIPISLREPEGSGTFSCLIRYQRSGETSCPHCTSVKSPSAQDSSSTEKQACDSQSKGSYGQFTIWMLYFGFFFFFGKPNLPNLMSLDGLPITLGSVLATLPLSVSINANMAKESCMPQTCEVTPGMSVQWELSFLCLYCKALSLHVLGLPFPLSSPSQKFWIIPWPALTGLFPVTFSDSRIPDSCESLGNLSPCTRGWILYVINLCYDLLVIGLNPYGITACWQCPQIFDINK